MFVDSLQYSIEAILQDGQSVHIRALRPDDRDRLLTHFQRLSPRSVYYRFFRAKKRLSEDELRQFTELDFVHNAALVATLRKGGEEEIIGVGRYSELDATAGAPRRAEVAFAVLDEYQGRGIGTLLLEHLVPIARSQGIEEFEADVLGENNQMLRVFDKSGLKVKRSIENGVFHVSFPTAQTEDFAAAHHRRERHAAAQSVRCILNPSSVAIIGASRRAGTIGAALVANIRTCGFTGSIYPINPSAQEIAGLKSFPSVRAIGGPVDLAIVAVPASKVEEAVLDCALAGVRGAVVISSGFGEVSSEGREAERSLRRLVRESGMRMVGPNCLGVMNIDPSVSLNATFTPLWPSFGNISILSQSGALGYALLDRVRSASVGLSSFVSVGNKADISGNDLLAYWAEDSNTQVIVLYLESFGNPRKFARVAPEVARRKPIIAVKSGRSAAGTRAASSHSAALASLDVAVDALFEQAGVIRTETLEALLDLAVLLSTQPVPGGNRIGVITNAGGPGILLADACESRGLKLPELKSETLDKLREFLPTQAGLANPIDMIASASPQQYARTIELVGSDPNIDALVVIYIPPLLTAPEEVARAIAEGAGMVPREKPILTVYMSTQGVPKELAAGPRGMLPTYGFPESAALALAAAERYGRWRKRQDGQLLTLSPFARSAVRAVVDRALEGASGPVWLETADVATVLGAAGIRFAPAEQCAVTDAVAVAERMGYPLVAKIVSPKILHKSDIGGVRLGIHSSADVIAAVDLFQEKMRAQSEPYKEVILQREIKGGVEALVGVTTDPTFGPLVVCGLGGVLVELLKDVSFRLTPVSDIDAAEMIAKLRANKLLDGYRGSPPGDRDALIDVIRRVSALVEIVPELSELDLNPVKVLAPGEGAIAVDGRMRLTPIESQLPLP